MANFLKLITDKLSPFAFQIKMFLAGALTLLVLGLFLHGHYLQKDLDKANLKIGSLNTQVAQQKSALEEADRFTKQLKADADAWELKARNAAAEAQKEAQKDYTEADKILTLQPPKDSTDAEAAEKLLNSIIKTNGR